LVCSASLITPNENLASFEGFVDFELTLSVSHNYHSKSAIMNSAVHSSYDVNLIASILLTYPVFISAQGLLNKLRSRVSTTATDKEGQEHNLRYFISLLRHSGHIVTCYVEYAAFFPSG